MYLHAIKLVIFFLDFGVGHVEKLCTMFHDVLMKQGIETDELVPEWKHLQCLVYRRSVCINLPMFFWTSSLVSVWYIILLVLRVLEI